MASPKKLLTQNSELRPLGIHNWSIPAHVTKVHDKPFMVCPSAGACARLCYAKVGTYAFSTVKAAHQRNLEMVVDDPDAWEAAINQELTKPRFKAKPDRPHLREMSRNHLTATVTRLLDTGAPLIRIHDGGDFFASWYLDRWVSIATSNPQALFYAYTKEVSMVRAAQDTFPENFLICLSTGGTQDADIDTSEGGDYHAEVFPSLAALESAGYYDQEEHDLLCVVAPSTKVGIVVNNIPFLIKRQGDQTFSEVGRSQGKLR